MEMKICPTCREAFEPNYASKRYCSRQCWLRHYNVVDREHGLKGAKRAGEVLAAKLRGTGTKGYVKETNGRQRHQHRTVAERILGRQLLPGEVVHHEDRNKKNNDPSNLIVFSSQSDHVRHHNICINQSKQCTCECVRLGEVVMPE